MVYLGCTSVKSGRTFERKENINGRTWIPDIGLGGGHPPEALNFFVTFSNKKDLNGLQHYQSTLEA